ncbi:MAG: LapA family protein [Lutibacter sp.]|nr:LapA family protein [Lutibacter sp.]MBP9601983.1 LapA family protein [Lutibacter sp.]
MKTKTIIAILFISIIIIFSLQNSEIIDVNFLFWKLSISRILVILGSFLIGILVGLLMSIKKKNANTI